MSPYRSKNPENYRDEDWLRQKYVEERMGTPQIAEVCECSKETIRRWLGRHGIERRSRSEATVVEWEKASEERHEQAREHYRSLTPPQVANGEHDPETIEKMSEAKRGENNPRWRGGTEIDRGSDWPRQREKALERDFYQCRCCRMSQDEHREKYDRGLTVHHQTPFRWFDGHQKPNRLQNLITLCVSCHSVLEAEIGG